MKKITLDAAVVEALKSCAEPTLLHSSDGAVVGYFEPPERLYDEGEIPQFDEEELSRRVKEWNGIPSSEVRRMLENLR